MYFRKENLLLLEEGCEEGDQRPYRTDRENKNL